MNMIMDWRLFFQEKNVVRRVNYVPVSTTKSTVIPARLYVLNVKNELVGILRMGLICYYEKSKKMHISRCSR